MPTLPPNPGYTVDVSDVLEVNLLGQADLGWWRAHLAGHGLTPLDDNGSAQLLISATRLRWMGVRFNEWSVSVALCENTGCITPDGYYLAQAFNSSRVFAFVERRLLRTPYDHARLRLKADLPVSFLVGQNERPHFRAAMNTVRPASARRDERWEGPLFLPAAPGSARRDLFYARLTGGVDVYPYLASDSVEIDAGAGGIWRSLHESGFLGNQWWLRQRGAHGKSRTLRWR